MKEGNPNPQNKVKKKEIMKPVLLSYLDLNLVLNQVMQKFELNTILSLFNYLHYYVNTTHLSNAERLISISESYFLYFFCLAAGPQSYFLECTKQGGPLHSSTADTQLLYKLYLLSLYTIKNIEACVFLRYQYNLYFSLTFLYA